MKTEIDWWKMYAFNENTRNFLGNLLIVRNVPRSSLDDRQIDNLMKKEFFEDPSEVEVSGEPDFWIYEVPTEYGYEGIQVILEEEDIPIKKAKEIWNEKDIFGGGLTWLIDARKKPYKMVVPQEGMDKKLDRILKAARVMKSRRDVRW